MSLLATLTRGDLRKTGNLKLTILDLDLASIGSSVYFPATDPGWVLCNGALVPNSGSTVALYAYLASRYGAAGKLPDFREGRMPIPKGPTYFTAEGGVGGESTHLLVTAEIPSHVHSIYNWGYGGGYAPVYTPYEDMGFAQQCGQQYSEKGANVTRPGGGHDNGSYPSPTLPIDGYDSAHENMPPYIVVGSVLMKL